MERLKEKENLITHLYEFNQKLCKNWEEKQEDFNF